MTDADEAGEPTRDATFVAESFEKWAPRYHANGLPAGDLERLREELSSWEAWPRTFADVGDRYVELGEEAAAAGHELTAGQHLVQAGLFYHFGSHVWHEDEAIRREIYARAVELFKRGGPKLDPPLRYRAAPSPDGGFEVPYHERIPATDDPRGAPVAILLPGLDSNKEEQYARQAAFLERGLATVAMDGAGQGETWDHQGITPDYHRLVSAVLDHLEARDPEGMDPSRVGIFGMSMGGFYAPHAAANDPRIDACVGVSGPFTAGPVSKYDFAVLKEQFQWACKVDSMVETDELTERLTLREDIDALTVPTLIVAGGQDPIIKPAETERIARRAPNAEYLAYPDGTHGCLEYVTEVRPRFADFLADHLT